MPRKEFEAFTRLDASDVNSFLMDQTVMSFAGTAARGSAIPSPVEGMTTFLEDSNLLSIYEGGVWRPSLASRGSLLQVVTSTTATIVTNSTTTYVDTGLSATMTPKSQSSKIVCLISQNGLFKSADNNENSIMLRAQGPSLSVQFAALMMYTATNVRLQTSASVGFEFSPNTLSAFTVKTQFANFVNSAIVAVQQFDSNSSIILMEVAN
jgi:hypothetical protein